MNTQDAHGRHTQVEEPEGLARELAEAKEVVHLGGLSVYELLIQVVQGICHDNSLGQAAQLAYYFLFALFPFLLFLATLIGFLPSPDVMMSYLITLLIRVMPGDVLALVQENINQLITDQRSGLLSFGIGMSLWTSSSAVMAISDNLNHAYGVKEARPFWKVRGTALLLVIGLSILIVLALVLLIFGSHLGELLASSIGLGDIFRLTWKILRWPAILFFLIFAMANIYYFAPDVEQKWKWITPGSVFAIMAWVIISFGFSFYVSNFGSYNKVYGSIGTFIVLLTWMYLLGFVVLVGGEINAKIEHAAKHGKAPGEKELPETVAAEAAQDTRPQASETGGQEAQG